MDRRRFIKRALQAGTCACAALIAADNALVPAAEGGSDEIGKDDELARFTGDWTEHLMTVLDEEVETRTKIKVMEECGRGCAKRRFKQQALKYKGDVEGLLSAFRQSWAEIVYYDKASNILKIVGKSKCCLCPLVRAKSTLKSGTLCLCSRGWMKEFFEIVTGAPVDVITEETIMTGGKRCAFQIYLSS